MFVKRNFLLSILAWVAIAVCLSSSRLAEGAKQPCKTCRDFVASFQRRFKDTEKSNYAGGDTSWEEEKLGSYANSEVRLVEILDGVCRHSDYECNRLLEDNEEHLETWWFKLRRQEGKGDLKQWLCFSHLDVCCPNNTYGPSCEECPGGVANPCSGRGKCEGSSEKDGSGECSCDKGYEGETCQLCAKGFYNDTDEEKFTCEACNKACKETCTGEGADMCDECAEGYELDEEEGACKDIDECKNEDTCKEGKYCLNLQGSHRCNACDKACLKICNGPGPSKCAECAKGYSRDKAGVCKDDNECEDGGVCKEGTYCENQPGSFLCKACHISCKLECSGPGASGCEECRRGYSKENDTCTDIDECSDESNPCDSEREVCQNMVGSYVCKCQDGLFKSSEGTCVTEDELPPEEKPKKVVKKKKKSKKGGKNKKSKRKAREEDVKEGEGIAPAASIKQATDEDVPSEQNSNSSEVVARADPSLAEKESLLTIEEWENGDLLDQVNLGAEGVRGNLDEENQRILERGEQGDSPMQSFEPESVKEVPATEQPAASEGDREQEKKEFGDSESRETTNDSKSSSELDREPITDEQLSEKSHDEL